MFGVYTGCTGVYMGIDDMKIPGGIIGFCN